MVIFAAFLFISNSWGNNCDCLPEQSAKKCGSEPAFFKRDQSQIARELGFDVPGDAVHLAGTVKGKALYLAFASFLEKSDRARMFYPEYFTKAAKNVSELSLQSVYTPKNVTEVDEYFRCTIPTNQYCLYKNSLRPYLGLAAKASGIDYSFLACQAYVESRFDHDVRSPMGAIGYAQIRPQNIQYMNQIIKRSLHVTKNRYVASISGPKEERMRKVQQEISNLWNYFWQGTAGAPKGLCKDDLTCNKQAFLAQVISLKTDMLTFATSSRGIKADFDEQGVFRIEGLDRGDSLLLLAGSYNLGVTKLIREVAQYCSGATKLKECLDHMKAGATKDATLASVINYIMRIRDCSQQFSAERIDFDDDARWTEAKRTEKQNEQRAEVVQCLLQPCLK